MAAYAAASSTTTSHEKIRDAVAVLPTALALSSA